MHIAVAVFIVNEVGGSGLIYRSQNSSPTGTILHISSITPIARHIYQPTSFNCLVHPDNGDCNDATASKFKATNLQKPISNWASKA
jgi:hypothetical protein